jgi:hypothetical protein
MSLFNGMADHVGTLRRSSFLNPSLTRQSFTEDGMPAHNSVDGVHQVAQPLVAHRGMACYQ